MYYATKAAFETASFIKKARFFNMWAFFKKDIMCRK